VCLARTDLLGVSGLRLRRDGFEATRLAFICFSSCAFALHAARRHLLSEVADLLIVASVITTVGSFRWVLAAGCEWFFREHNAQKDHDRYTGNDIGLCLPGSVPSGLTVRSRNLGRSSICFWSVPGFSLIAAIAPCARIHALLANFEVCTIDDLGDHVGSIPQLELIAFGFAIFQLIDSKLSVATALM